MALKDSLISHWKLEEASGNRADSFGSNTLTDNNTVTSATGKIGTAGQFTAANSEYLSITDNASVSTGDIDFTFSLWAYLDSKTANRRLLAKSNNVASSEFLLTYRNATDRFDFTIADGAIQIDANTLGSPSTGTWYFIVAWHDAGGNTLNIQINDGTVDSTGTSGTAPSDTAFDFQIGRVASEYMDGRLDEVSFWKRTLTSGERTQLYNSGNGLAHDQWDQTAGGFYYMSV